MLTHTLSFIYQKPLITTTSVIKALHYQDFLNISQIHWYRKKAQLIEKIKLKTNQLQYRCSPLDLQSTIQLVIHSNNHLNPLKISHGPIILDSLHQGVLNFNKNILKTTVSFTIQNQKKIKRQLMIYINQDSGVIIFKGQNQYQIIPDDITSIQLSPKQNKIIAINNLSQQIFHKKVFQNKNKEKSFGRSFYREQPNSTNPIQITFQNNFDCLYFLSKTRQMRNCIQKNYFSKQLQPGKKSFDSTTLFRQTRQTDFSPLPPKKKKSLSKKQEQQLISRLTKSSYLNQNSKKVRQSKQKKSKIMKLSEIVSSRGIQKSGQDLFSLTKQNKESVKSDNNDDRNLFGNNEFYIDEFQNALFNQQQIQPQIINLQQQFQQLQNSCNIQKQQKLKIELKQRQLKKISKQKQIHDLKKLIKLLQKQAQQKKKQNQIIKSHISKIKQIQTQCLKDYIFQFKSKIIQKFRYQQQLRIDIKKIKNLKRITQSQINIRQQLNSKQDNIFQPLLSKRLQKKNTIIDQEAFYQSFSQSLQQIEGLKNQKKKSTIPNFLLKRNNNKVQQNNNKNKNTHQVQQNYKKIDKKSYKQKQKPMKVNDIKQSAFTPNKRETMRNKPGTPIPYYCVKKNQFNVSTKQLIKNESSKCLTNNMSTSSLNKNLNNNNTKEKIQIMKNFSLINSPSFCPWNYNSYQKMSQSNNMLEGFSFSTGEKNYDKYNNNSIFSGRKNCKNMIVSSIENIQEYEK